jgi:hypothetical protein
MSTSRKRLDVSGTSIAQKETILKYAAEVRNFEIEKFWQRSIFFWGFIGAAFVAYAQLFSKDDLSFYVACFGLVCSVAWTLQNRGSKSWQEAWETKVESVERDVLGVDLFANREPLQPKGFWGAQTFSVSRLTIALSDFYSFGLDCIGCKGISVTPTVGGPILCLDRSRGDDDLYCFAIYLLPSV